MLQQQQPPHVLPHVDQVLGQGHRLRIAGDGDGSVHAGRVSACAAATTAATTHARITVLTVGDPNHGPAKLPLNETKQSHTRTGTSIISPCVCQINSSTPLPRTGPPKKELSETKHA